MKSAKRITKKKFEEHGPTAGSLLRLCQGIFGTGKVVILDSGFCVLAALMQLLNYGTHALALVKKRRHWPRHIRGDFINAHFEDKKVGEVDCLPGTLSGSPFKVVVQKEPNYNIIMMTTHGTLGPCDNNKKIQHRTLDTGKKVEFFYTEVVGNHYAFRNCIDKSNAKRHDCGTKAGISLENAWKTTRWPCRAFACIVASSDVNGYCGWNYFGAGEDEEQMLHRKHLARELIMNNVVHDTSVARGIRRRPITECQLIGAPKYKKFIDGRWRKHFNNPYQQIKCCTPDCPRKVRTVCTCSKEHFRCNDCWFNHKVEVETPRLS